MAKTCKVPVIMQMEALECGAACLCMIAAYYKKWIPLTQVRADCGVSRDGSIAKNILNAGRSYGFKAAGYKLEPASLDALPLPAIIHWNFNHFVVLTGFDFERGKIYLNDPASGRRVVSLEEFDQSFTGIALTFEPTEEFKPEGKQKSVLTFAKRCLKGALKPFLLAMAISTGLSVLGMLSPVFNRIFLDNLLSGSNPEWFRPFLTIMIIVMLVQVLIEVVQSIYWLKIEGKFAVTSSSKFMWHVLRLPLEFFSQRYIGDIVSRQESTATIALTLIKQIAPMFIKIISMFFYLFFMLKYSWVLTLIGVGATVLNMLIARYSSNKMLDYQRAAAPNQGKILSVTYTGFEMIETIKSTGAESGYFERWAGFFAKQNNDNVNISRFTQYFGAIPSFISTIADMILLFSGVYLIIHGEFTIGMLMAFQSFLSSFLEPIDEIVDIYSNFVSMRCDMERVEDVLDYPTDVNEEIKIEENCSEKEKERKLRGEVKIDNITFGYGRLSAPLIQDFSVDLKPGSWVAIIGGSGSGKSTIAKLVTGLYKPWSGKITFDGKTKDEIDPYRFHSSVAIVDQDKVMFHDTIKNNIKMWDESIEDFAVIMAAKDSDIHESIVSRPDGYNHVLSEGGKDFSGGQCQRIEIARALAQEPSIIILDEATSALDAKTEHLVMENVRKAGCTCIVIAHRLSTIRDCDEIIVLDKGSVVERGKHEDLMKLNGKYKQLVITE
ncbi:MAG: NHLP family bacteriocin export ABC transporter peptidase/permease/ATPase subunit [Clostridia bacterium]|nr:NHLP family bacteriocin export ABC transporter peptidase/permease/ATPase subunit [Clostridia bacterium]